jgi:hypothetical protein
MANLCLVPKCRVHGGTHELVFNDIYAHTLIMAQRERKRVDESVVCNNMVSTDCLTRVFC